MCSNRLFSVVGVQDPFELLDDGQRAAVQVLGQVGLICEGLGLRGDGQVMYNGLIKRCSHLWFGVVAL